MSEEGGGGAERGIRISRFLAAAGIASRRDAELMIAAGRVRLNGVLVAHPATFVGPADLVQVDGKAIDPPARTRLWRYHKPAGLLTTHRDPRNRPTVFASLPPDLPRVISVGRLDLASEGLLLLTNDGALARRLELPSTGWKRRYRARVHGVVEPAALAALSRGITIAGISYGPITAQLDARKGTNSWLALSLCEGRNREVRRVLGHLGLSVSRLIRIAYGPFQLGHLPSGHVQEVQAKVLREQLGPT
ncbi:MAG: pseudouridine synthase [Acetobacteraceae bacterium]